MELLGKPPTFPFYTYTFVNDEKYNATYTTIILALVTKLNTGIIFGADYAVVQLIIHQHTIYRYEMLYNLISYIHPGLMQNKATRPSNQHSTAIFMHIQIHAPAR